MTAESEAVLDDDGDEYIVSMEPRVPTQEELNEKHGWNR